MQLQELATSIGASIEVTNQLLETYGLRTETITPQEINTLKAANQPGQLSQKTKRVLVKTDGKTSVVTTVLSPPELPKTAVQELLPEVDLGAIRQRFSDMTVQAIMPSEQAAREGIADGFQIAQGVTSDTDNFFRGIVEQHQRFRLGISPDQ
jgi:hypothetical protein